MGRASRTLLRYTCRPFHDLNLRVRQAAQLVDQRIDLLIHRRNLPLQDYRR